MKKIIKVIISVFLVALSGCSNFLEENLQGKFSSATFFKSQQDAILAINGVYNSASFISTNNALWVFGDVASDDATKGGGAGDQGDILFVDQFNYVRSNTVLENTWKQYYDGISRANYVLYYVPPINMDVTLRNRILGEAKFLRAYFYFNLVNIYGEIPLKLIPPFSSSEVNIPKSSVDKIYTQIVTDLQEAIKVLPKTYTSSDLGRVTKGAAWGMLAKAHLYQEQWSDVLTAIDSLDAAGDYSLVSVYKNNFIDSTQNNTESIFEIQHLRGQGMGSYLSQYFSPSAYNGYYFNAPLQNFVDEFETAPDDTPDPRLDYTVGRAGNKWVNGEAFDPSWSPTGYLNRKNSEPKKGTLPIGDSGLNYVYMRYADILLMKAEALNELNRGDEAIVPLNAVRKRARESYLYDTALPGFGTVPTGLLDDVSNGGKQAVTDAIRHERRVELGFEFHRYFDLMRYGQSAAEAALNGTGFNYSKRYFLIPQSELDTNPAITN